MKLTELLKTVFKDDITKEYRLGPNELKLIKDQLLLCDEFKNVDELIIMEAPNGEFKNKDESTFVVNSHTTKLMKDTKYKGTCYLYNISLSPLMYTSALNPVKDGIGFVPAIVSSISYDTQSNIIITFPCGNKEELKSSLLKVIDNLDNLQEYTIPQFRHIAIRGFFLEEVPENNTKELVIEDNKPVVKDVYRPEPEIIEF